MTSGTGTSNMRAFSGTTIDDDVRPWQPAKPEQYWFAKGPGAASNPSVTFVILELPVLHTTAEPAVGMVEDPPTWGIQVRGRAIPLDVVAGVVHRRTWRFHRELEVESEG